MIPGYKYSSNPDLWILRDEAEVKSGSSQYMEKIANQHSSSPLQQPQIFIWVGCLSKSAPHSKKSIFVHLQCTQPGSKNFQQLKLIKRVSKVQDSLLMSTLSCAAAVPDTWRSDSQLSASWGCLRCV